jgi:hypothetical protein
MRGIVRAEMKAEQTSAMSTQVRGQICIRKAVLLGSNLVNSLCFFSVPPSDISIVELKIHTNSV